MQYRKFTAEEKTACALAYNNGANLKELAERAGVSIPTMAKYVRAGGGNLRKPGLQKRTTGDAMKIVEQVNEIMAQANPQPETVAKTDTQFTDFIQRQQPVVDRLPTVQEAAATLPQARTILAFE